MRKRTSIIFLVVFLQASLAFSEILVFTDKNTKSVEHIVTSEADVILSDADKTRLEKTVMPGELEDYDLTEQITDYKIVSKKFVINTKKISDLENAAADADADRQQKEQDFQSAKAKLINLGLTDSECEALK